MRGVKRIVRAFGLTLGFTLVSLFLAGAYFRLDTEHVFHEIRGTYRNTVTLDAWASDESSVRLVEFRNHRGEAVATAYYRRPLALDPDYRIVLTYAGAKTGKKILELIPERPDVVLLSMQYPYESPETFMEHLRWPLSVRQTAFRSVAGGMLAVDFLQKEEALDLDRLAIVGVSVGAPFATIHGALDERVPTVVLIHGGGNLPGQVLAAAKRRWLAHTAAAVTAIFFDSFEPLHYVDRIAPRKLIMIADRHDRLLPVANVEQLFAAAREPKQIFWTDSGHVRSNATDLIADIVAQVDQYLD